MTETEAPLRALYYPFSRSVNETTLKRAVLLYDEILFVDPMSSRVRAGLFDIEHHLPYLPPEAARALSDEWTTISGRYDMLTDAGLVRFIDSAQVVENPTTGQLIGHALRADLDCRDVIEMFQNGFPTTWSMLRTRIPQSAFQHLAHQIPARVLSGHAIVAGHPALYIDGHPDAVPTDGPQDLRDDGREYAALLPYPVGSSIAVSTALALAVAENAVPLTDSDAHFRLLSARMARAAAAVPTVDQVPGLTARPDASILQKTATVQQRVVDSVVSHADLDALSLSDCLRYRDHTAQERTQFRALLRDIVATTSSQPSSPQLAAEIEERINAARRDIKDHQASMRNAYRSLFKRTLIGLSVAAAPALITAIFPFVSPLTALLLGGGPLTALLSEPIKDLLTLWTNEDQGTSSLAYLMDLPTGR